MTNNAKKLLNPVATRDVPAFVLRSVKAKRRKFTRSGPPDAVIVQALEARLASAKQSRSDPPTKAETRAILGLEKLIAAIRADGTHGPGFKRSKQ